MAFRIELTKSALAELKAVRAYDRKRIVEAIDENLPHEPAVKTKNRKLLKGVAPGFEHVPPLWELRVGEFRVFYDVDEDAEAVFIRAVRVKKPHQRTEDVIR